MVTICPKSYQKLLQENDLEYNPYQVMASGAKQAIHNAICATEEGDEAILIALTGPLI